MALADIIMGGAGASSAALPVPRTAGLTPVNVRTPPAETKRKRNLWDTVGRVADAVAIAGGSAPSYRQNQQRFQAEQAAETARVQAEAQKMQQENAFATIRANPQDQGGYIDLAASGYEKAPDFYKTLNPQMSTSQGSQPREVVIAQMLADPATPQAVRDQLERLVNTPVYRGTPDGGTAALPKLAPPGGPAQMNPQAKGVRNNNLGNLKDGAFARSQPGYKGVDGTGFAVFETPEAGTMAQVRLLQNNYLGKGFNTPLSVVNRYAPPGTENSQASVNNYARYIADRLGIGVSDPIPQSGVMQLAKAMQEFENGATGGGGIQAQQVVAGQPKPGFTLLSQSEVTSIPGLTPGRAYQRDGLGKISAVEGAGGKGAAARAKGLEPGKLADVEMMIGQLRLAESELEKGGVSGPIIGVTPDPLLRAANPRAVDVKETVAAVTQRNLREILGGQFAQKEGEQLINRAYNPGLPEAVNLRRVRELRQAIEKRRDDLMGGSGMVRVASPEEAARLPAGTQFTTPDGRVMVKR